MGVVFERAGQREPDQIVDGREKGRERLARSGGRGDQRVPALFDRRPREFLRRGGRGELFSEPVGDGGVKEVEAHLGIP